MMHSSICLELALLTGLRMRCKGPQSCLSILAHLDLTSQSTQSYLQVAKSAMQMTEERTIRGALPEKRASYLKSRDHSIYELDTSRGQSSSHLSQQRLTSPIISAIPKADLATHTILKAF